MPPRSVRADNHISFRNCNVRNARVFFCLIYWKLWVMAPSILYHVLDSFVLEKLHKKEKLCCALFNCACRFRGIRKTRSGSLTFALFVSDSKCQNFRLMYAKKAPRTNTRFAIRTRGTLGTLKVELSWVLFATDLNVADETLSVPFSIWQLVLLFFQKHQRTRVGQDNSELLYIFFVLSLINSVYVIEAISSINKTLKQLKSRLQKLN